MDWLTAIFWVIVCVAFALSGMVLQNDSDNPIAICVGCICFAALVSVDWM